MSEMCLGDETLAALLEGRADWTTRARIEAHSSRCASCRRMLSSLARTSTLPGPQPSEPALDGAMPRTQFGRYVFAGEIGAGGMGVVYAAHDPELDRLVAVKLLRGDSDPQLQQRLRREAQAMAQLAHPNVVAVHDVGAFEGRMFIAMEYVEGETLARWLSRPQSQRAILEVFCAAGRGLAAAHAAGIVHRDFKPENVLIGRDGRVRVGDFGLACPTGRRSAAGSDAGFDADTPLASSESAADLARLTTPGTLLGTRYYMAPELYRGVDADARSDQFSFCVALFTALHGRRPFDGDAAGARAGHPRPTALRRIERSRVPRRIRAALRRGLAVDPAARFASLDELLDALTPSAHRLRRPLIGLAAAVAVLLVLVAWYSSADSADQRCTGAPAAFASAWNPGRRASVETAFAASTAPYAGAALARVTGALDQYAMRWTQAHTEACRATRILGEQTEATLDLRMACLERRRQEVAALVGTLSAPDGAAIGRSVTATESLGDIAGCADVAALRQIVAPPNDAAVRAKLAELAPRLASAHVKYELGAWTAALELARKIVAEAHALDYPPFEAEARFLEGDIELALDDTPHGEASLEAAVWLAEAGRHDEIAARGWVRLVSLVGFRKAEYVRGLSFVPRATAALARLGGNADIESRLERALGLIDASKNKTDDGIAHHEKAVKLREQAFGNNDHYLAITLEGLGIAVLNQGHADRAVEIQLRAHTILEQLLGPSHPDTAHALTLLANARTAAGQPAVAEREIRQALAIEEATLGPDHGDVGASLAYLATALDAQGKIDDAIDAQRKAIAIEEGVLGREHPLVGERRVDLATLLTRRGHTVEARDQLQRAETMFRSVLGPDHDDLLFVSVGYGDVAVRERRWRDALAFYQRAMRIIDSPQITRKDLTQAVIHLERAALELHQPARGLALLERLASRLDEVRPQLRASVELMLARALWDSAGDRKRAYELASRARAAIAAEGASPDEASEIERWFATHHLGT